MSTKSTKSTKSVRPSRVSARTYRIRRIGVGVCVTLAAVCLWLLGANWGMARVEQVAQADQATVTSTPHVRDVAKQATPAPQPSEAQPTDVQAYRAWLASLPQSLDDIPACQVETGEDAQVETADTTVYVPVCRWDAALSGNGRGESYVLAYGQKVMSLNYR